MQDPTTPAALAEKYDALRYDALSHPVTHPDHIAAVVTMFGFEPPPVASARVLEVGCNDGSNLLPMAASLPDARFVGIREAYVKHIERMLGFAGVSGGKARAEQVLALETALAKPQWDRAKRRDRDRTYNVVTFAELQKRFPGYDWDAHLKA